MDVKVSRSQRIKSLYLDKGAFKAYAFLTIFGTVIVSGIHDNVYYDQPDKQWRPFDRALSGIINFLNGNQDEKFSRLQKKLDSFACVQKLVAP